MNLRRLYLLWFFAAILHPSNAFELAPRQINEKYVHVFLQKKVDDQSLTESHRANTRPTAVMGTTRKSSALSLKSRNRWGTAGGGSSTTATAASKFQVLEQVGSGSYGTVHSLQLNDTDDRMYIGKRAWNTKDLSELQSHLDKKQLKDKAQRCRTYWEAELHCLQKLKNVAGVPKLKTTVIDQDNHEWMVFDWITCNGTTALSLDAWMALDREDRNHHLYFLSQALGVSDDDPSALLTATLDEIMNGLLKRLSDTHAQGIVHRDVKPANILISDIDDDGMKVHLIDFGSAADLDTGGPLKKNIGLSTERVAISPIYTAPEIFINSMKRREAINFDCFSVALIYCQLLFQYLDERTDAGFHQQIEAAEWNLNAWLATEISGDFRPAGIDLALKVLSQRPGLWTLLQDMLKADPWKRVDSKTALRRHKEIIAQAQMPTVDIATTDGAFLSDVLKSLNYCQVPEEDSVSSVYIRPLQFVATFRRGVPLGLVLAEPISVNAEGDFEDDDSSREQWLRTTATAVKGEVYVKGIVPGGQAEQLGIFEIGDRLQGIGELPLAEQGFERAVQMLQDDASPDRNYITLHFDRQSYANVAPEIENITQQHPVQVIDQGAWSSQGRRKYQEDAYILHELYDKNDKSIVLAGVADGHLGKAASSAVREQLPIAMTRELLLTAPQPTDQFEKSLEDILGSAWNSVCDSYRNECLSGDDTEGCRVADYNPKEGTLEANTGSISAVAGTTANFVALDRQTGRLAILNCGDSRSFVITGKKIVYKSRDHKPERELDRFRKARESDPSCLYEMPGCRFSRWFVPVGEYEYAVSRSLEGPFATARGVVSDADLHVIESIPKGEGTTIVVATDGLWEICDTAEVAGLVYSMRFEHGKSASDAAKILSSRAIERGSSDNVSVVILYLD